MSKELEELQAELNNSYPQLLKLEKNIMVNQPEPFLFYYDIFLKNGERSCLISEYGYEKEFKCVFEWDSCSIFEIIDKDVKKIGEVVLNWVFKKLMPSVMKTQFHTIEFGKLADYYEKGEGVKGEFIVSWDSIEEFYGPSFDDWSSSGEDALRLIKEMRGLGFDEKLRAGQSLWFFILSRSRRHGLKENASYLKMTFLGDNRMVIKSYMNGKETTFESDVKYKGYLQERVEELLKEKIE